MLGDEVCSAISIALHSEGVKSVEVFMELMEHIGEILSCWDRFGFLFQ